LFILHPSSFILLFGGGNPEPSLGTEDRDQRSEIRGQGSEVRGQKKPVTICGLLSVF
jgi:hypothetical protein